MSNAQIVGESSPWSFGLPDRLAKALAVSGVSHARMAECLGVSTNTVGNYTSGRTAPRPPVIQMWASETGAPLEWLLTGVDPTPRGGSTSGGRRSLYLVESDMEGIRRSVIDVFQDAHDRITNAGGAVTNMREWASARKVSAS